ncbi:MAG: hypothetical protein FWE32_02315 [Oscillospiraceae bacterium]|nr:hypothetical protein [Oscillospiraceae bacterium]
MKKVASLLLIFTLVLTMGVGAFAAEDPTALQGAASGRNSTGTPISPRSNDAAQDAFIDGVFDEFISIAPSIAWTGNENQVSIGAGEIFLVSDGMVVRPEANLLPNSEYNFDIYYNPTGAPILQSVASGSSLNAALVPLTEAVISGAPATPGTPLIPAVPGVRPPGWVLDPGVNEDVWETPPVAEIPAVPARESTLTNGRLRVRAGRGTSNISNATLRTRPNAGTRRFQLELTTRETYTTRMNEVTITLSTTGELPLPVSPATAQPVESTAAFDVGWPRMTRDEIDSYTEGDTVTLSNNYPVIMRAEMERLVRNHNFRPIHLAFDDGSWEFTGRMSGMGDTNFYTTQEVVPALVNRLDQDFKFLSLPAGVTFPANGEMKIDVSDVSGDWNRIYTYLYRNGTLTPISTNYDSMDDMITFRTNFLGSFIMTDVEITDMNLVSGENNNNNNVEEPEPEGPNHPNVNNPATGVAMGVSSLLTGLGTISLLGAGALVTRRRK